MLTPAVTAPRLKATVRLCQSNICQSNKRELLIMLRTLAVKRWLLLTVTLLFTLVMAALGQTTEPSDRPVNSPANNKDRAGHLPDLGSLSPATLPHLLQPEPGSLLEIKKALLPKASA